MMSVGLGVGIGVAMTPRRRRLSCKIIFFDFFEISTTVFHVFVFWNLTFCKKECAKQLKKYNFQNFKKLKFRLINYGNMIWGLMVWVDFVIIYMLKSTK